MFDLQNTNFTGSDGIGSKYINKSDWPGTWLGWPGPGITEEDEIPESSSPAELSREQVVAVHLSPEDYELYYNGCCNATLWPLFHSMPDRAVFDETFWQAYKAVNVKFANEVLDRLRQLEPVGI